MKISNELVEEICANVLAEHRIERDEEDATALLQVVWEMGTGIEYETAIQSIIEEAIKADRARRFESALEAARFLKSDDGENEEYDRALVELICETHLVPGCTEVEEKLVYVEEKIGVRP